MLDAVRRFVAERTGSNEMADGLIYVCQAGSVISGTNDETSDLDFRGITHMGDRYFLGLKSFEHTKLVGCTEKINAANDSDIELRCGFTTLAIARTRPITIKMLDLERAPNAIILSEQTNPSLRKARKDLWNT